MHLRILQSDQGTLALGPVLQGAPRSTVWYSGFRQTFADVSPLQPNDWKGSILQSPHLQLLSEELLLAMQKGIQGEFLVPWICMHAKESQESSDQEGRLIKAGGKALADHSMDDNQHSDITYCCNAGHAIRCNEEFLRKIDERPFGTQRKD